MSGNSDLLTGNRLTAQSYLFIARLQGERLVQWPSHISVAIKSDWCAWERPAFRRSAKVRYQGQSTVWPVSPSLSCMQLQ